MHFPTGKQIDKKIHSFQANIVFLYPLKTLENQMFSDAFRGYRKGKLAWNGLLSLKIEVNSLSILIMNVV